MLRRTFQVLFFCVVAVTGATSRASAGPVTPTDDVPASAWDCASACNDCEGDCNSRPAGNIRNDCVHACTSAAAKCCAGYGKKPPTNDCYCR
jgi:hypothetical protein